MEQIQYTDYIGLMLSSITTIINAITYVLIAFVAVSLVVSSIMIGVITLISVQERTKEIGILRAIGASKRNVSSHVQRGDGHHRLYLRGAGRAYHLAAVHPHQRRSCTTSPASSDLKRLPAPAHGTWCWCSSAPPLTLFVGHHPLPQRRQERPCGGLADGVNPGEILLKKRLGFGQAAFRLRGQEP